MFTRFSSLIQPLQGQDQHLLSTVHLFASLLRMGSRDNDLRHVGNFGRKGVEPTKLTNEAESCKASSMWKPETSLRMTAEPESILRLLLSMDFQSFGLEDREAQWTSVLDSMILPYMVKFSDAMSCMIWPEPWSYHMRWILYGPYIPIYTAT